MDKDLYNFTEDELVSLKLLVVEGINSYKKELKSFMLEVDFDVLNDEQIKNANSVIDFYNKMIERYNAILVKIKRIYYGGCFYE